ncbi:RDD family protein [bacterium]|nr:RDD family protein [bacterium]
MLAESAKENANPVDLKYRTFRKRAGAGLIDVFLLFILSPIFNIFRLLVPDNHSIILSTFLLPLTAVLPIIYSIAMHAAFGQTLGKMALGIKVVDFENESPISKKQAIRRDSIPLVYLLLMFPYTFVFYAGLYYFVQFYIPLLIATYSYFFWFVVEVLTMIKEPTNRALQDKLAKTVVIRYKS